MASLAAHPRVGTRSRRPTVHLGDHVDGPTTPEGIDELIALPLRLVGFDASPVRAILRTLPR